MLFGTPVAAGAGDRIAAPPKNQPQASACAASSPRAGFSFAFGGARRAMRRSHGYQPDGCLAGRHSSHGACTHRSGVSGPAAPISCATPHPKPVTGRGELPADKRNPRRRIITAGRLRSRSGSELRPSRSLSGFAFNPAGLKRRSRRRTPSVAAVRPEVEQNHLAAYRARRLVFRRTSASCETTRGGKRWPAKCAGLAEAARARKRWPAECPGRQASRKTSG